MATDPSLHDDIVALGAEVRDLTDRFSAKEELAARVKRITRNDRIFTIAVAIVVVIGLTGSGIAVALGYKVATCQGKFNKATELRSALLTDYTVTRDDAMKALVEARGLPNDPAIIEARDNWLTADAQLSEARSLNPVPKYEDYCGNIPGVPDPKVRPAKVPHPSPAASSPPKPQ